MKDWIYKDFLFCDDYRAVTLCEYQREIALLKRLIELAENAVNKQTGESTWSRDGICHLFAKSVVDYAKIAYDNFLLGHFSATNMIMRTIIENNVCLDIILNDEKDELWKYYLVQSYRNSVIKPKKNPSPENLQFLEDMYRDFGISKDFYEKGEKKKAYIDIDYGWTYKVNNQLNFSGLCTLVDRGDYSDFKMMSDYSHGTAVYLKLSGLSSIDHIMNMITGLYIGLYRLVTMYCWGDVEPDFDEVTEEIENIIYDYIDETEALFNK